MSHLTTVETQIEHPDAIRLAAETLGVQLQVDAIPRFYYGVRAATSEAARAIAEREAQVCDFVLVLPGAYDLGLKRQADGRYAFVCDSELLSGRYGQADPGRQLLGDHGSRFLQEYAAATATLWAQGQGYAVDRTLLASGDVELTVHT